MKTLTPGTDLERTVNVSCLSDCLLATPATILISDKDVELNTSPISNHTSSNISPDYEKYDSTKQQLEFSTQYPLKTSLSTFRESDSSLLESSHGTIPADQTNK